MRTSSRPPLPADEQTVRIARRRFVRRQWARRWLAWRRLLLAVLTVAAIGTAVWVVFFSSVLAVAGVTVSGAEVLDPRQVRRVAAVPSGSPLATVDLDAVAARVEELAAVRSVDVSRAWPDRVRIDVREREAVAVVERDGRLRGLDRDGVLFRDYPSRPSSLPLLRTSPGAGSDALAEAARVVAALPRDIGRRVDFVEVATVDRISLRLRKGGTVLWGSAQDSADKAKVLAVLLDRPASLYDVTVPGKPVIRR